MIHAYITEVRTRNGESTPKERFSGSCRTNNGSVRSNGADPEYDLCHRLVSLGLVGDGPITFWRGGTPSLTFPSIKRAALCETRMDEGRPGSCE
jgi:hypothetical protein